MDQTPNLELPYIMPSQAQKHVTHNEALRTIDVILQLAVIDRDFNAPPLSPAEGDRYIVAAGATGGWAGQDGRIAAWQDGGWTFLTPGTGWIAWLVDEAALVYWTGSAWINFTDAVTTLQNLSLLGIGTTADTTNPFSAKLNKALWTARTAGEGGDGDLRYTMNKETATDVLSLLMQSGFSGRAELGLIGDDNLTLKVSPDGTGWTVAMRVNATGAAFGGDHSPSEALHVRKTGAATARIVLEGEAGVSNQATRYSDDTGGPFYSMIKARGTIASPAAPAQNDAVGTVTFSALDPITQRTVANIQGQVIAAAPSSTDMQGRLIGRVTPAGSVTPTEVFRWEAGTGFSMFGANTVIDANRIFRLRSYTIATLPSASTAAGQMIYCSDLGGGGGQLNSDGTAWRRVSRGGQQTVSSDAAFTLTALTSAEEQKHTGTLTADRAITLSATNAYAGARFRVTRTGAGAFNLSLGGLKDLATNTWAEVVHDGASWYLAGCGAL